MLKQPLLIIFHFKLLVIFASMHLHFGKINDSLYDSTRSKILIKHSRKRKLGDLIDMWPYVGLVMSIIYLVWEAYSINVKSRWPTVLCVVHHECDHLMTPSLSTQYFIRPCATNRWTRMSFGISLWSFCSWLNKLFAANCHGCDGKYYCTSLQFTINVLHLFSKLMIIPFQILKK